MKLESWSSFFFRFKEYFPSLQPIFAMDEAKNFYKFPNTKKASSKEMSNLWRRREMSSRSLRLLFSIRRLVGNDITYDYAVHRHRSAPLAIKN